MPESKKLKQYKKSIGEKLAFGVSRQSALSFTPAVTIKKQKELEQPSWMGHGTILKGVPRSVVGIANSPRRMLVLFQSLETQMRDAFKHCPRLKVLLVLPRLWRFEWKERTQLPHNVRLYWPFLLPAGEMFDEEGTVSALILLAPANILSNQGSKQAISETDGLRW